MTNKLRKLRDTNDAKTTKIELAKEKRDEMLQRHRINTLANLDKA